MSRQLSRVSARETEHSRTFSGTGTNTVSGQQNSRRKGGQWQSPAAKGLLFHLLCVTF